MLEKNLLIKCISSLDLPEGCFIETIHQYKQGVSLAAAEIRITGSAKAIYLFDFEGNLLSEYSDKSNLLA